MFCVAGVARVRHLYTVDEEKGKLGTTWTVKQISIFNQDD